MEKEYGICCDQIFIKTDGRQIRVKMKDIVMLKGSDNYVKVVTVQKKYLLAKSRLGDMAQDLAAFFFCEVHRSYVVNMEHVEEVYGDLIKMGCEEVPLGKNYRERFFRLIWGY